MDGDRLKTPPRNPPAGTAEAARPGPSFSFVLEPVAPRTGEVVPLDATTPRVGPVRYLDGRTAVRAFVRTANRPDPVAVDRSPLDGFDSPPLAGRPPAGRLLLGVDVVPDHRFLPPVLRVNVVLILHEAPLGRAYVQLVDARTREPLASFDRHLRRDDATIVAATLPLTGADRELVCEAHLAEDPRVRATAIMRLDGTGRQRPLWYIPPSPAARGVQRPASTLAVALEVDVQTDEDGGSRLRFGIVITLHGRSEAAGRVALVDGQSGRTLRRFDPVLSSERPTRIAGRLGLARELELLCEVELADEPLVRGTAFAWVVPSEFEWRVRHTRPDQPKGP
jgi:hypothetical protein